MKKMITGHLINTDQFCKVAVFGYSVAACKDWVQDNDPENRSLYVFPREERDVRGKYFADCILLPDYPGYRGIEKQTQLMTIVENNINPIAYREYQARLNPDFNKLQFHIDRIFNL